MPDRLGSRRAIADQPTADRDSCFTQDLRDDARADRSATLTDGEAHLLFHRDRR